jgi:DNA-binding XRE family transcriptional regulator
VRAHEYLALELKRYRSTWGLTQREVAARAGTTQRIIAEIELGKYNPSLQVMERLAKAFGMRLEVAFKPELSEYTHKGKSGSIDV